MSATPAKPRWYKPKWLIALLATVMVVAFGVNAFAADPTFTLVNTNYMPGPNLTSSNMGTAGPSLMELTGTDGSKVYVYCIDVQTGTSNGVSGYQEVAWASSGITNLGKLTWVVNHSYPNLTPSQLAAAEAAWSGQGQLSLTVGQAVAATQGALWFFADGYQVNGTSSWGLSDDTNVMRIYNYLKANAVNMSEPQPQHVTISPNPVSGFAGSNVGPITVTSDNGQAIALSSSMAGAQFVYTDGTPVNMSAVVSGKPFVLKAPATAGSLTLTATSTVTVASGRVFKKSGYQTLIAADSYTRTSTTSSTISWVAPTQVAIPATPSVTDPCGSGNATWNQPANTSEITWSIVDGRLIATTKDGFVFTDGTTKHDYGTAPETNTAACTVTIAIPAMPDVDDPCGTNNATWKQPADTTQLTWSIENGHLIVRTKTGFKFTDNTTMHDYGVAQETNTQSCVVQIPVPAAPDVYDPCGSGNAVWLKPTDSTQVAWTILNGRLIASAKAGFEFADGTKTHDFGVATETNTAACTTTVTIPDPPSINDPCGSGNATWMLPPNTNQITWTIVSGHLIATTASGFTFSDGTTRHDYGLPTETNVSPCTYTIPVPPTPSGVYDPCGSGNAVWIAPDNTNQITWTIVSGHLIATTTSGFKFADGTTSHDYGTAPETNTAACTVVTPLPPTPTGVNDPCGSGNATWMLPPSTTTVTWTIVDGHLIAETKPGYVFSDGTTKHDYGTAPDSAAACPVELPVPPRPSVDDPCGANNATWRLPLSTTQLEWTMNITTGHIIVKTKPGFVFADGTTSHDYGVAPETNTTSCDVSVPVPATPSVFDPCGAGNAMWVKPADTAQVAWTLENARLIASTKPGFVFADGTKSHDFGLAPETNTAPCTTTIPIPPAPAPNDPCGEANATWNMPPNGGNITWSVENGRLIATTATGFVFTDGTTRHDYGTAPDSGVLCPVKVPVPPVPPVDDPCGPNNSQWMLPQNTTQITWTIVDGHLIATTNPGFTFSDGTTRHDYGTPADAGTACPVEIPVPMAPQVTDPCGSGNATWGLPASTNQIEWVLNVTTGVLTATAKPGFVFADGRRQISFGVAPETNTAPCVVTVPVPPTPVNNVNDPCGPNNAVWMLPGETPQLVWKLENGHLIAETKPGFKFADGTTRHDYGLAADAGTPCPTATVTNTVTPPPVTNTVTQPPVTNTVTPPPVTNTVTSTVTPSPSTSTVTNTATTTATTTVTPSPTSTTSKPAPAPTKTVTPPAPPAPTAPQGPVQPPVPPVYNPPIPPVVHLPYTGIEVSTYGLAGFSAIALGGLLLLLARRRRYVGKRRAPKTAQ